MAEQHAHDHDHSHCGHNHAHASKAGPENVENVKSDPRQRIIEKENEVGQTLSGITQGLQRLESSIVDESALVQKEFVDLLLKLQGRRDSLIAQLREIKQDKKTMLLAQQTELEAFQRALREQKERENVDDIDASVADSTDVALVTKPEILLNIDNAKLSQQIARMGDINNTFPPNAPKIGIDEVKAHTCTISFSLGDAKYGGFAAPDSHAVEIAFGPKNVAKDVDDAKVDFAKLKWKEIARRENASFVRVKKLKPDTLYFVRVRCKNEYGWSNFCRPTKLVTYVLKLNTKIMNSDEIQVLIDVLKEQRNKQSLEWKLLFRGSDDGFLARTFHMKCDGIPNTVVVIQSEHGNVFGGFTTLPWQSDVGRYHVDEEAFVFIVRKKGKTLKKGIKYLQYTSSQHSVVHNKYMGPVFGYGHDIYIRNKADQVSDNSCRNHTYQCSFAGELAGEEKFKVINYEVFQISHPQDDDDDDAPVQ